MKLKNIKVLSKKSLNRIDKDIKNLEVYLVEDYNNEFLKRLVNFGINIFGELGADKWELVPKIRYGNVFILKEKYRKRIIGLAIFMRDWEDNYLVYLSDYAIAKSFHGYGLGYIFLKIIIDNLKEQGLKRIRLTVDTKNKGAIKLYRDKIGFDILKLSEEEYGKDEDRYVMELKI